MSGKRLTAVETELLKGMLKDGTPGKEIAEAFGISKSAVTYHAVRMGVDRASLAAVPPPAAPTERPAPARPFTHEPWMDEGVCAQTDPEIFFPEKGGDPSRAKAVCASCAVAAACLEYALTHNEHFGIWGGLSDRERRTLRKTRAA
jgi:WhiB family redox-sensing transcriptional regulator